MITINKIDKTTLFLIVITALLVICAFFFNYIEKSNFNTLDKINKIIKDVTINTKLIDANYDHNQALDVADYAVKNDIEIPSILINFDTHSDIYLNYPVLKIGNTGIENWINEYIAKYPNVKEIYWVMPDEEAANNSLQKEFAYDDYDIIRVGESLYGNSLKKMNLYRFNFMPLTLKSYKQNFIINTTTGNLNEYVKGNEINKILFPKGRNYKKIKIITCTKNTLPDFKGKSVFLSIDADYISNSGFDTVDNFKIIKTPQGIESGFYDIFKTLYKKNIRPEIISMSISPQYLPKEHHNQVQDIFNYITEISGHKDKIQKYARHFIESPNYLTKIYKQLEQLGLSF
jgi:hypothetical protein